MGAEKDQDLARDAMMWGSKSEQAGGHEPETDTLFLGQKIKQNTWNFLSDRLMVSTSSTYFSVIAIKRTFESLT